MENPDFPTVSYADWLRKVGSVLDNHVEGIDLAGLCTVDHPERLPPASIPIGPGRRSHSDLLADGLGWTPCQTFDCADPKKLNHYLRSDLQEGVTGIRLRLDRAGRKGEDPLKSDGVGVEGAALYLTADYAAAFDGVPENWRLLVLDAGGSFLPSAAQLLGWLMDSDQDLGGKTLLLGADPLGALARDGGLPAPFPRLAADMAELLAYGESNGLESRALSVSTQTYREAGAEIDQEVAIALASGVEVLRRLEECGVEPTSAAAQFAFMTATGQQIFLEIAKLRALRVLWDRTLRACGVEQPKAPWIHSSVLRRSLPSREPSLNLLRATNANLASILGGADSLETPEYDWASTAGGTERGRRLARNTQLILGLEGQLGRVDDPAKGSYWLETVTDDVLARAWSQFQEIEKQGGLLAALTSGWLQDAIQARWEARREALERGDLLLTGINIYPDPGGIPAATDRGDPSRSQEEIQQRISGHALEAAKQEIPAPPGSNQRWLWCQKAAAQNLSLSQMSAILYVDDGGPVVKALQPRSDSDPFPNERGTP